VIANSHTEGLGAALLDELSSVVSQAGAAILSVRSSGLSVQAKADRSPVTQADHASEAVMLEGISRLLPGLPIVSEEKVATSQPPKLAGSFMLVDPLDGTREFIAGRDEFTINLALVVDGRPRLGIVAAPARGLIWRGIEGQGAERLHLPPGSPVAAARGRAAIHARPCSPSALVAALSRSHLDPQTAALLSRLPVLDRIVCGSAVKFCQLAEGIADVYPRLSTTCEWDVAAGQAVLVAAGGMVLTPENGPLAYGRADAGFRIPAFVAWGDPAAPAALGLVGNGALVR
jgi:3'(2'), 5'-bisphosphate nucleotidase